MKILSSAWKLFCKGNAAFWAWYKSIFKGRPWYIKTVSGIGTLIVLFMLYLGAVDLNLFWLFGKSPGWAEIKEHRTAQASELYSADFNSSIIFLIELIELVLFITVSSIPFSVFSVLHSSPFAD